MRVMTQKEQRLYSRLIRLAGGDVSLVEEAIRKSASKEGKAKLPEIVQSLYQTLSGLRSDKSNKREGGEE